METILESTIECPKCSTKTTETMPTNACVQIFTCPECSNNLKPNKGDCCVYCSWGDVACPPIQAEESCCDG